jgi:hypothetical protein
MNAHVYSETLPLRERGLVQDPDSQASPLWLSSGPVELPCIDFMPVRYVDMESPMLTNFQERRCRVEYFRKIQCESLPDARMRVIVDLYPDGRAVFTDSEFPETRWYHYIPSPEELRIAINLLEAQLRVGKKLKQDDAPQDPTPFEPCQGREESAVALAGTNGLTA